ncbi:MULTISPECIES: hypothetical protein [Lactobacillus]|uniref:hypothetical protein n=1 Tax=Lactobacillus TaxID=1578 RepID=UPI00164823F5|nr:MULTISPECIES: hypothetical protein [Lactobacillus]MCR1904157.1 hypothetical protein [Lactobacillus taiwanensis]
MKCLNGKQLRDALGIGTTVFYKFKNSGMPCHKLPQGRTYYLVDEVLEWLRTQ